LARSAAEGELELARVRRVRADLIERVAAFGRFDPPKFYQTPEYEDHYSKLVEEFGTAPFSAVKPAADLVPAMSSREPQRTAEGVRGILPELVRLLRYESRAVRRRDRAIRDIALRSDFKSDNL
jgi:hypothetical protein